MTIQSFADLRVENGKRYFYRISEGTNGMGSTVAVSPRAFRDDDDFLEFLQAAAFDYFWCEADAVTGLVRDRSVLRSPCSIAAVGFGLTAIPIGVEHGWISRVEGGERSKRILRVLVQSRHSSSPDATGYKGWFYHFIDGRSLQRYRRCEVSSMDTALLLAGVLAAEQYFNREDEAEIRSMARELAGRIDWQWMLDSGDTLRMGWHPESGFIQARWKGYNEGSLLYLLGLGAEKSPLTKVHWTAWTRTYDWRSSFGSTFIHFAPLFGHQYTACWVDFRQVQDDYTRAKGITYFENSRRATLAQRQYVIENPKGFPGYQKNVWGLTACDGPARNGIAGYAARGAPPAENDDGTLAPTAPGGSLPFAPQECLATLRYMYDTYREQLICGYGFRDAFNLSVNWWDPDVLGIDQGPILIMIENHRTGKVWEWMRNNTVIARGMERAGFRKIVE